MSWWWIALLIVVGLLALVAVYDLVQRKHTVLRNFPVIGHLRFILEAIGPELRQYIVTDNDEERPFSRDQRRWVYATAKKQNPYFGFGTDNDIDVAGSVLFAHAAFPHPAPPVEPSLLPAAKVLGGWRDRPQAFRPASIVSLSAMSFGALSGPAIEALNEGAAIAGCLHNTGEGGISDHHRRGGDLVYQIGTGYFGCRDASGAFDLDLLLETIDDTPVRAIEVKLSQGAKAGLGGVLPAAKVTAEIARARGVPEGVSVLSPARHAAFDGVEGLVDFVETIAAATGLPVGIKSAVGQMGFWTELVEVMDRRDQGPDFVTIDGGEGGTGAGPLVFTDHVALPFRVGFARVYQAFVARDLHQKVVFSGSGKLGFAADAMVAIAMGCDLIGVGREAMLSIGCIQAQRCHTGHCPTGVATHNRWLTRGLDPSRKAVRLANYVQALNHELRELAQAMGAPHPAIVDPDAVELMAEPGVSHRLVDHFGYRRPWTKLGSDDQRALAATP